MDLMTVSVKATSCLHLCEKRKAACIQPFSLFSVQMILFLDWCKPLCVSLLLFVDLKKEIEQERGGK